MVDEDKELELDVNESKSTKKTIIIIAVVVVLLNAIGVGAWLFFNDGDEKKPSVKENKQEVVLAPLTYLTMVPEFIVNFGPESKVRYLQVDLQISTRDESSLDTISTYRPVLRNDILVLLSDVSYDELKDRAGKEALQKRLLGAINKVVVDAKYSASEGAEGETEGVEQRNENAVGPIENVYFVSFIMQ